MRFSYIPVLLIILTYLQLKGLCLEADIYHGICFGFECLNCEMVTLKICSKCNASFKCGATEANGSCWCTSLPNIVPMPENEDCLCPDCLTLKIREMELKAAIVKGYTH
jgi:hypothetical protein